MAENMISNRPEAGKTFQSAMWVIGVVAALQLFGVFWAIMKRPGPGGPPESFAVTSPAFQQPPPDMTNTFPPMPLGNEGGQEKGAVRQVPAGNPPTQIRPSVSGVGSGEARGEAGNSPPVSGGISELSNPLPPVESAVRSGAEGEDKPPALEPVRSAEPPLDQPSFVGPEEAVPVASGSLTDSLTQASLSAAEIADPIVERLVTAGVELRSTDNMQGALQALKEAEAALPQHPRIMSELAATYRQMGLDAKAENYWEKVESLGEIGGGAYYPIARQQLRGEAVPAPGTVDRIMKIGEVIIEEKPAGDAAQVISARIIIEAEEGAMPDGESLSVLVFFYDQVDGSDIKPSTADTSYLFPTEPYDWKVENREEIVVNYSQPVFSEEEARELGERKYFGYVIQLYYQDELQDRVVRPPELETYHLDTPLSAPQPSGQLEPENALFPDRPGM